MSEVVVTPVQGTTKPRKQKKKKETPGAGLLDVPVPEPGPVDPVGVKAAGGPPAPVEAEPQELAAPAPAPAPEPAPQTAPSPPMPVEAAVFPSGEPPPGAWIDGKPMFFVFDDDFRVMERTVTRFDRDGVVAGNVQDPIRGLAGAGEVGLACKLRWIAPVQVFDQNPPLHYVWITQDELHREGTGVLCMCARVKGGSGLNVQAIAMRALHNVQFEGQATFPVTIYQRGEPHELLYAGTGFACDRVLYPVVPFVAQVIRQKAAARAWTACDKLWVTYAFGMWSALAERPRQVVVDPFAGGFCAFYAVKGAETPCMLDWRSIVIYGPKLYADGTPPDFLRWLEAVWQALARDQYMTGAPRMPQVVHASPVRVRWDIDAKEMRRRSAAELLGTYKWR